MNEQNINLSLNLVNGVMQYLGTRPYAEVFQLMHAIQAEAAPQVQKSDQAPDQPPGSAVGAAE